MNDISSLDFQHYLIDQTESLTPLPSTVIKLISLASRADSRIEDVEEVLRADVALAAVVLSEANSASSGASSSIATIRGAVVRLGNSRVAAIAANRSISGSEASLPLAVYDLEPGELVRHSQVASYVAETIHRLSPQKVVGEVVAAALLHDLGQVVLDQILDPALFRQARRVCRDVCDAERELVDTDHAEVGAYLLKIWGIPRKIITSVRFHHEPAKGTEDLAYAVNIASQIADYVESMTSIATEFPDLAQRHSAAEAQYETLVTNTSHSLDRIGLGLDRIVEESIKSLVRVGLLASDPLVSVVQSDEQQKPSAVD